jgi:hypothetical protein
LFLFIGIGLPPPESAQNTRFELFFVYSFFLRNSFRSYFGEINITGNTHDQSAKTKLRLKEIEQKSDDAFVFLSDVWLDDKKVD